MTDCQSSFDREIYWGLTNIIYGCSGDISYECDCLQDTRWKTMDAIGCYDNSTDFILIWNMLIWLMSRKFPNLENNGAECALWRCRQRGDQVSTMASMNCNSYLLLLIIIIVNFKSLPLDNSDEFSGKF